MSNRISGKVTEIVFLGESLECRVAVGDTDLVVRLHPSHLASIGEQVTVCVDPGDVAVLTE